jgi:hypothetical protein
MASTDSAAFTINTITYPFFQQFNLQSGQFEAVNAGPITLQQKDPTSQADSSEFTPSESVVSGSDVYTYLGTFRDGIIIASPGKFYFAGNTNAPTDFIGSLFDQITLTSTTIPPVCFLAGTLILTPEGPRAIESLAVGDLVSTARGPKPVKFLAQSTRSLNTLRALGKMPIRMAAGALGNHGPERDTYLSPSHAIALEGHLVEAGALLNGSTITQLEAFAGEEITYFNIECERHELIWANGMQAESYFASYRTNGFSRDSWDNYANYLALYGESAAMDELDLPRIPFARQLPASVRLLLQKNETPQRVALKL